MFKLSKVIETKADQIEIVAFGDIHLGNPNCKFNKFKEIVNYIKNTPNCYGIGMGDYIECILPKDKRFDPHTDIEVSDPVVSEYIDIIVKTLEPIKDKILCLLTGNHEYHIHSDGYCEPTKEICRRLFGSEKGVYGGFSAFLKLKVKPKTHRPSLVFFLHHGWCAGRKTGSVVNNVEGLSQYWDADVYLVGHSHKLWATRQVKIGWGGQRKVIFGNTGTFLETCSWGKTSYSERAAYPPLKLGVLKIKYYPKRGDIHVSE